MAVLAFALGTTGTAMGQFWSIDPTDGGLHTAAHCISADGRTVAGASSGIVAGVVPYRWTVDGGRVDLTNEPTWAAQNFSTVALSGDGSVMVGAGVLPNGRLRAYRWSGVGTLQNLGIVSGYRYSESTAVSRGGEFVAGWLGYSGYPETNSFLWSAQTGMQAMGDVPWGGRGEPVAVSTDGTTVIGYSNAGISVGWRWTRAGGYEVLPPSRPGFAGASARAANADCSIIVGGLGSTLQACMWSSAGVEELGPMNPTAVDDLGTIVVGSASSNAYALIWTRATGVVRFTDYLAANGVSVPDWFDPYILTGVSADGKTICGTSRNGSLGSRAFVVHIPTPSGLVAFGLLGFSVRRRRLGA